MLWKTVLAIGLLALVAAMLYVRLTPVDARAYAVDPETVKAPGFSGHVLLRPGGDIEPATYALPPKTLAARMEAIILATPRTERIAGALEDGMATYVTRSALWGFPDVATVKIVETEGGSALRIFSRLRYGAMDMGVNRARVEGWLSQL